MDFIGVAVTNSCCLPVILFLWEHSACGMLEFWW